MREVAVKTLLRRNLRGIWHQGMPPARSAVWAPNHHNYWDPFVATFLAQTLSVRSCVLMEQENLAKHSLARIVGAFGTREPRRGLGYLRDGRIMIVYPEGVLRPAGPVGPIAPGAAWFARQANVSLWAMATRIVVRGHSAPEAYVYFSHVGDGRLAARLAEGLSTIDNLIAATDPRLPLPGFHQILRGRKSPEERMQLLTRSLPWAR